MIVGNLIVITLSNTTKTYLLQVSVNCLCDGFHLKSLTISSVSDFNLILYSYYWLTYKNCENYYFNFAKLWYWSLPVTTSGSDVKQLSSNKSGNTVTAQINGNYIIPIKDKFLANDQDDCTIRTFRLTSTSAQGNPTHIKRSVWFWSTYESKKVSVKYVNVYQKFEYFMITMLGKLVKVICPIKCIWF